MGHEKEIQENGEIAAIEHMMMEFMKTRDAIINKIDTLKPLTTKEKISRAFAVLYKTTLVLTMQRMLYYKIIFLWGTGGRRYHQRAEAVP